jgi:hypothetical protein
MRVFAAVAVAIAATPCTLIPAAVATLPQQAPPVIIQVIADDLVRETIAFLSISPANARRPAARRKQQAAGPT